MATHDLQNIIDAIIVIQQTVSAPSGEKAIQAYHDEPPATVQLFPCFLNMEQEIEAVDVWMSQGRTVDYIINMHLLFAPNEQTYSVKSRRTWVRPVLDAFGVKLQLDGTVDGLKIAVIRSVNFDPVLIGETEYVAVTFELAVRFEEAFAWAV